MPKQGKAEFIFAVKPCYDHNIIFTEKDFAAGKRFFVREIFSGEKIYTDNRFV